MQFMAGYRRGAAVSGLFMGILWTPGFHPHPMAGSLPARAAASSNASISGGTLLLSGSMRSSATISMTGAFSVGHVSSLTWDLPMPRSMAINGYTERFTGTQYTFNIRPSWSRPGRVQGNGVMRFHWNAPPADTVIRVTERLTVSIDASLASFHSGARFPLATVPASIRPYTKVTPLLHLFRHGQGLAHRLARSRRTEQSVVEAVANWVASSVRYDGTRPDGPFGAGWVLQHRATTCRGFANAMAALLRYEGVPTQVVYGWVSPEPITLRGRDGGSSTIRWGAGSEGEMHAWLNIYFPGSGWVPFDPQHEKFFVDPRHFAFSTHVDARTPKLGTWSAEPAGNQNVTGADFSDGYPEIAPGDGILSRVSVRSHDDFHASMDGIRHDVSDVLMLSR